MLNDAASLPKLDIRPASDVPSSALLEFHRQIDPIRAKFRSENWRWLYRVDTPDGVSAPLLAMYGSKVIGHAGLIPVNVKRGNETRKAIWYVDFWVLPEFQRKGVGIALTKAWMALCPLQVTFCNEKSAGVFRKFGWNIGFHHQYRLLLHPEKHARLKGVGIRQLSQFVGCATRAIWKVRTRRKVESIIRFGFDDSLLELFEVDHGAALHVPRTSAFINWRINENPLPNQFIVFELTGHSRILAVARLIKNDDYRILNILMVRSNSQEKSALSALFACILRWAISEDLDEVCYVSTDPMAIRVIRKWLPIRTPMIFASHGNDPASDKFLSGHDQFWEPIDSDNDLARFS